MVEILNGATALFDNPDGAMPAADLETLLYGLPISPGHNSFTANGRIRLRGDAANISSLAGPESDLILFVTKDDLEIESRIHNEASGWDTSGVDLWLQNVEYVPEQKGEVFAPDFNGIWFADSPCIKPWNSLLVAGSIHSTDRNPWASMAT